MNEVTYKQIYDTNAVSSILYLHEYSCNTKMEKNIKIELMKSVDSIKNKIKHMKDREYSINMSFDKILKPVTGPLNTIVNSNISVDKIKKIENSSFMNSEEIESDNNSTNLSSDFEDCYDQKPSSNEELKEDLEISLKGPDIHDIYDGINIPFGIRSENKILYMGNKTVSLSKVDSLNDTIISIKIGDKAYNLTPGLKELLLRKKPNLNLISNEDKIVYKDMLQLTNAHKRDFNPENQMKGDKGIKYCDIIRPLFLARSIKSTHTKLGGNLSKLKKYKKNTDLVYWDDPNELVERLKLLIASRDAGNTNHDNEILSIIEELKEAGIVRE